MKFNCEKHTEIIDCLVLHLQEANLCVNLSGYLTEDESAQKLKEAGWFMFIVIESKNIKLILFKHGVSLGQPSMLMVLLIWALYST